MVQRVVAAAPQLQLHLFRSTDDKLLVSYPDQHRRSLDVAQVSRLAAYIDEVSGRMSSWNSICESKYLRLAAIFTTMLAWPYGF